MICRNLSKSCAPYRNILPPARAVPVSGLLRLLLLTVPRYGALPYSGASGPQMLSAGL